jgi:hypothetical protein
MLCINLSIFSFYCTKKNTLPKFGLVEKLENLNALRQNCPIKQTSELQ